MMDRLTAVHAEGRESGLRQGREEGRREILDELAKWIEEHDPNTGRKFTEWVWGKRRIEQFIKDSFPPAEGGSDE